MDIKIYKDGEEVKEEPQVVEEPETTMVLTDDILTNSVGQMFDLKPSEIARHKNQIGTLLDYAKTQTDERSPESLKWVLRSLQNRLGSPPLGEKWLPYLSKYAWLKLDEIRLKKEVEKYEHNH
jgi:hypothetical protein